VGYIKTIRKQRFIHGVKFLTPCWLLLIAVSGIVTDMIAVAEVRKMAFSSEEERQAELLRRYGQIACHSVPDVADPIRWSRIKTTEQLKVAVVALTYKGIMDGVDNTDMIGELVASRGDGGNVIPLLSVELRCSLPDAVSEFAATPLNKLIEDERPDVQEAAKFLGSARWFDGWRLPRPVSPSVA